MLSLNTSAPRRRVYSAAHVATCNVTGPGSASLATFTQVARLYRVHPDTIGRWAREGRLNADVGLVTLVDTQGDRVGRLRIDLRLFQRALEAGNLSRN